MAAHLFYRLLSLLLVGGCSLSNLHGVHWNALNAVSRTTCCVLHSSAISRNTLNNVVRNRTRLSKVLVIESLIGIKGNLRVIGNAVSEIVRVQIQPQVCIIVVSTTGN